MKGKYYEEYTAQYKKGDAGTPDGITNFIVYTNIMEDIKFRKPGWAGRIIRMEEQRIQNRVLNGNFRITRQVGRPRNRWADVVRRDARQLLGIRGWRIKLQIGMNGGVL